MDAMAIILVATPFYSDYLSVVGFFLTIIGFAITTVVSLKAKSAADAAKLASDSTRAALRRIDFVSETATILQLIEELKRLQRSGALDLLPDRYSNVRARLISVRESGLVFGEAELSLVQDVISRVAALEQLYDSNPQYLDERKRLTKSNQSLSVCSEAILVLVEKVNNRMVQE